MLADFFLQILFMVHYFVPFRDIIMGYTSITDILDDHPKIKERVENWQNYKFAILSNVKKRKDNSYIRTIQNKKLADYESNNFKDTSNADTRNDSSMSVINKVVQPTYAQID